MAMNPHPQFYHPAYICISGQSYSGKTYFLLQLLSNVGAYFDNDGRPFRKIVYCYGSQWQDIFEKFQAIGVTFHAGLPAQDEHLDFGVFCEKLKLAKRSVGSLIDFNCTIKYSKCRMYLCYTFN